jgi:prephenate dehydrogenase
MAIIAPSSANSESIKLAVDLTQLLGASPFFADLLEVDGLMAATHLLPQLLAAALLNATVDQPGWREARKMTGRSYAQATSPLTLFGEAHTLTASAMFNRENALRLLDNSLAALSAIRNDIEARDEAALDERLKSAHRGRLQWWSERQKGDWLSDVTPKVDLPENPGVMGRLFGVRRKPKSIN